MKRIKLMRVTLSLIASLIAVGLNSNVAMAFPGYSTTLNTFCNTEGRSVIPSDPNATLPEPFAAANCTLCHNDGNGGSGAGKTAWRTGPAASTPANPDFFCQLPPPPPVDTDGDGVVDGMDNCPGTPAGSIVDANGCAIPQDDDNDGVVNGMDNCPNTPAGSIVDANGCAIPQDDDNDGVVNGMDNCPNTPAGSIVDANGCAIPQDDDNDGVVNGMDNCPNTPAGSIVDANGCAIPQDDDNDGVVNGMDNCPNTPAGSIVDANGCAIPQDDDNDGVVNGMDNCPNTPAGSIVDANGCAIPQDDDNDGVVNGMDQCPNTPAGAMVDTNGCEVIGNSAPVLDMIPNSTWLTGETVNVPLNAMDVDGDTLSFSVDPLPSGFILTDNTDGTGSISGSAMAPVAFDVTVTVKEDTTDMLSDHQTFSITIMDDTGPVVMPMYMFNEFEAEYDREKKVLKYKAKLVSVDSEDDDMCSPMEGTTVTASTDGYVVSEQVVNCKGSIRARGIQVQPDMMTSCMLTLTAESVETATTIIGGCGMDDHEDDDHEDDDHEDDDPVVNDHKGGKGGKGKR